MFSDDLDKALATFVLANGAAATGQKVTIFFTFWGLNVIKKLHKPKTRKRYLRKDVRYDAAFQFRKAETLEDEHGRNRGKNDAVYHE